MRRSERGVTLIEAMVAMVILLVGAMGMMGLHSTGVRMESEAREITRATAIAQDLMNQIQTWQYTDARLANGNGANDVDVADDAGAFATTALPPADHGEADLTLNGLDWNGVPSTELTAGGFERYWNVSTVDMSGSLIDSNSNGVADGMRIAVVVRWPRGATWHRIVLVGFKLNPADRL
jgi:prepilin-type N-terminal cleavage/methylation domain-containing protein